MKTSHANPVIATYTDVVVVDRELVVICITYGWVVGCAKKVEGPKPLRVSVAVPLPLTERCCSR